MSGMGAAAAHGHVILGAGGPVSVYLARELAEQGLRCRCLSRRGVSLPGAESIQGDLTILEQVASVVDEPSTVYLLAGLPYDIRIWRERWPLIIQNAIETCRRTESRLIYFDNVYMYGRVEGPLTEATPHHPSNEKGKVRTALARELEEAFSRGTIRGLIARSADFYGPYADAGGIPNIFVFSKLIEGKKPAWLVDAKKKHSFTFVGDCGKALRLLAESEEAYNQAWHLPTSPAVTGEEFIALAAKVCGKPADYQELKKWMIKMAGIFDRSARNIHEMLYQYESDYIFDSSKFLTAFPFVPTPPEVGIRITIEHYLAQTSRS